MMIKGPAASQTRWMLFAIVAVAIGVAVHGVFGSTGLVYTVLVVAAWVAWVAWEAIFMALIKPRPDIHQDPAYQKNVRELLERHRRFESDRK